jgi:hypothetical protein
VLSSERRLENARATSLYAADRNERCEEATSEIYGSRLHDRGRYRYDEDQ